MLQILQSYEADWAEVWFSYYKWKSGILHQRSNITNLCLTVLNCSTASTSAVTTFQKLGHKKTNTFTGTVATLHCTKALKSILLLISRYFLPDTQPDNEIWQLQRFARNQKFWKICCSQVPKQ